MHAGMTARWHQVTSVTDKKTAESQQPLFFALFTSDKGTEDLTEFTLEDFLKMYGDTADFSKHGQPLLQVHNTLYAGARILGKRLVADDATLANIVIYAEVEEKTVDKKNAQGQQLYLTPGGEETTEPSGNTKITFKQASIKYSADTVASVKTLDKVEEHVDTQFGIANTKYPLFIIADNGRGVSAKRVRISPDYLISKRMDYQLYNIIDIENTTPVETARFSIDPDAVYAYGRDLRNMSLTKNSTTQFSTQCHDKGFAKFIEKVAEITGYSREQLLDLDALFGRTTGGRELHNIVVDPAGIDIDSPYGIELKSGTNGNFGDAPFAGEKCSDEWKAAALKFLDDKVTDQIYDMDLYKLDAICDANYPVEVKNKIVELAQFRKDGFYFRDLGTKIWSYNDVYNTVFPDSWKKTAFAGDYLSTYEIIDPYSKKQIRVTCLYSLSALIAKHLTSNIAAPLAGEFNGFVVRDAVPGTLNFAPRHTPSHNQKEMLDDLRVNFLNYSSSFNELTLQSTYTSQPVYGPLSFINNVIVTQMALKAVRKYVPKIRFRLTEGNDFASIARLVDENVLSNFKSFFTQIELIYTQDDIMSAQKLFNASLECYYYQFSQSELFDVYAIEGVPGPTGNRSIIPVS